MIGLDIHVLVHPDTPTPWVNEAVASVKAAQECATFPTALHVLDADTTSIGKGRMAGYAKGKHAFVTSVDDDDWVLPNAFYMLRKVLRGNPVGVTTGYYVNLPGAHGLREANTRDNLRVFRRDVALTSGLEEWPVYDSWAAMHHADTFGEVVEVDVPVYCQRAGYMSNNAKLLERIGPSMKAKIDWIKQFDPMRRKAA